MGVWAVPPGVVRCVTVDLCTCNGHRLADHDKHSQGSSPELNRGDDEAGDDIPAAFPHPVRRDAKKEDEQPRAAPDRYRHQDGVECGKAVASGHDREEVAKGRQANVGATIDGNFASVLEQRVRGRDTEKRRTIKPCLGIFQDFEYPR